MAGRDVDAEPDALPRVLALGDPRSGLGAGQRPGAGPGPVPQQTFSLTQ